MNRVIAAFKKVRLRQVLMTFLAGFLLFVSTACNNAKNTGMGSTRQEVPSGLQSESGVQAKNPRPEVPEAATTNRFQGGTMNEFSDIDPRTKQTEGTTRTSAQELIENAKRNIDQPGDVGEKTKRSLGKVPEGLDNVGANLKQSAEDVKNKAQGTADNLGRSAKQSVENVKDSTTRGVNRAAEDVKDNTRGAFSGLNRSANRAGENVKESARGTAYDLDRSASRAVDKVADKAQRAAENTPELVQNKANEAGKNTSNFIQDKVNQFVRGAERTVDKTTDTLTDAVD